MDNLVQDLRYTIRSLVRQPSFALTAILTLALGIGATTTMFGVVNAVILQPLPFRDASKVVAVTKFWTKTGVRSVTVSAPDFDDWKARNHSFAALGHYWGSETSVTVGGTGDYADVHRVTPGFFEALGVTASQGRLLSAEELHAGSPLSVVITDAYWRRQFGAAPDAVGSTLKFGERIYTIVGVLAPGQRYPARADIYSAAAVTPPASVSRGGHNYRVIGRLKSDVTIAQAHAEMQAIARQLEAEYPADQRGQVGRRGVTPGVPGRRHPADALHPVGGGQPGDGHRVRECRQPPARARDRCEREMVVRAAVGAARSRLIRQLLTESVVLAAASAICGIALAQLGVRTLAALAPADLPRVDDIRVDGLVLVFALIVALVASIIFGLAPALQVSRVQLVDGLRQGGKGTSIGARGAWARNAFVVAEIALAVVLVFGAGLLARSLLALAAVDMGFVPQQISS